VQGSNLIFASFSLPRLGGGRGGSHYSRAFSYFEKSLLCPFEPVAPFSDILVTILIMLSPPAPASHGAVLGGEAAARSITSGQVLK
jgi:hypothetical protein